MTSISVPPGVTIAPLNVTQSLRVLCLGPICSGKTVLIKSIQYWLKYEKVWGFGEIPEHDSTSQLSVNFNLHTEDSRKRKRIIPVVMEEIGGSRSATWPNYYNDCTIVMFVIDSANPFKVSSATCQLTDALGHADLVKKNFLVAFTKNDVSHDSTGTLVELQNMMFYDDVIRTFTNPNRSITTVSCSGLTCDGVPNIIQWMQDLVLGIQPAKPDAQQQHL